MAGQGEAGLGGRGLGLGAEDGVKLVEGRLSPDAKAADVATGGELQQVEAVDLAQLHTWDVVEGLGEALVLVVDHKGTLAHDEAAVAHLTLAGAGASSRP